MRPLTKSFKMTGFQPLVPECWGHRGVSRALRGSSRQVLRSQPAHQAILTFLLSHNRPQLLSQRTPSRLSKEQSGMGQRGLKAVSCGLDEVARWVYLGGSGWQDIEAGLKEEEEATEQAIRFLFVLLVGILPPTQFKAVYYSSSYHLQALFIKALSGPRARSHPPLSPSAPNHIAPTPNPITYPFTLYQTSTSLPITSLSCSMILLWRERQTEKVSSRSKTTVAESNTSVRKPLLINRFQPSKRFVIY